MSPETLTAIFSVCAVGFIIHWWLKTREFFAIARKLPGLNGLPFVGNIIEAIQCDFDPLKIIKVLHKYQGKDGIVKFWRCHDLMVMISDPEHQQVFFTNEALLQRSDQYTTFDVWLGKDNILTASVEPWKRVRKMMVQTFNSMALEDLIGTMTREAGFLVVKLNKIPSDEWIQLQHHITGSGYRLFTKVAIDEDLDNHQDLAVAVDVCDDLLEAVILRVLSPLHFLNITFPWTKEGRSYVKMTDRLREVITNVVRMKKAELQRARAEGKTIPNRYLYNLLSKYKDEPESDLINQLISLYSAGVDTTATAVGFTILMIAIHDEVQTQVFDEDAEIQGRLAGKPMDLNDFQEYQYLERVIKETLRIYPVFPMIGREAMKNVYLGEYLIPKGTTVFSTPFWTNRKSENFADPLRFDPDRFLPENAAKLHPFAYTPFSAGIKNCIGNKFAMISMKTTIFTLVRNFKIISEYRNIGDVDENLFATINLQDRGKVSVRLEKR